MLCLKVPSPWGQARRRSQPGSSYRRRAPHRARARMPGQYSTRGPPRPRLCGKGERDATGRLYPCARCGVLVVICSCCDRGNIYCEQGCAEESRRSKQRAAGRRYQRTRNGRRNHAARAGAYRARQKNVTHRGSPPQQIGDVLPERSGIRSPAAGSWRYLPRVRRRRCHWCGRPLLSPLLRTEFLRRGRGTDP